MNTRRFIQILAAGIICPTALAGGKKGKDISISFHLQADPTDNPKMIFSKNLGNQRFFFRRTSEVNLRDVAHFGSFPSEDGEGYGLVLELKPGAIQRIAAITTANRNRWLLARVNGRDVDAVLIEKPVEDGKLVIWKGVGAAEITALDHEIPRIGQKKPRL